jgi:hypothetical protein
MDTQRFNRSQFGQTYNYPEYNKLQKEYEEKINRDLLTNPETEIFDLTGGGLNSLKSTLEVPNYDITNQFAEVTKQDLARYNKGKGRMAETIQKTNLQDLKEMGIINPTMTEYEFNQLKKGNITQPGTYIGSVPNYDITNQLAYVTEQDIARRDMQLGEMQKTNYETAKDIGLINPTMTEYEYNQLIQGNITKPGTYVG